MATKKKTTVKKSAVKKAIVRKAPVKLSGKTDVTLSETVGAVAAHLAYKPNWVKGRYNGKYAGQHCFVGTTRAVNGARQRQAELLFAKIAKDMFPNRSDSVAASSFTADDILIATNDHKNTTHKDIVTITKKASEVAKLFDEISNIRIPTKILS